MVFKMETCHRIWTWHHSTLQNAASTGTCLSTTHAAGVRFFLFNCKPNIRRPCNAVIRAQDPQVLLGGADVRIPSRFQKDSMITTRINHVKLWQRPQNSAPIPPSRQARRQKRRTGSGRRTLASGPLSPLGCSSFLRAQSIILS